LEPEGAATAPRCLRLAARSSEDADGGPSDTPQRLQETDDQHTSCGSATIPENGFASSIPRHAGHRGRGSRLQPRTPAKYNMRSLPEHKAGWGLIVCVAQSPSWYLIGPPLSRLLGGCVISDQSPRPAADRMEGCLLECGSTAGARDEGLHGSRRRRAGLGRLRSDRGGALQATGVAVVQLSSPLRLNPRHRTPPHAAISLLVSVQQQGARPQRRNSGPNPWFSLTWAHCPFRPPPAAVNCQNRRGTEHSAP
jgi:hypothetical protein